MMSIRAHKCHLQAVNQRNIFFISVNKMTEMKQKYKYDYFKLSADNSLLDDLLGFDFTLEFVELIMCDDI